MPAIDPDRAARESDAQSSASEIVELIVVTRDAEFLQTLRRAAGRGRRVWHVPSADKAGDLLVAGDVGILVVDVATISGEPAAFVAEITRQFPDLVAVLAGNRETEMRLAPLISAGTIHRYIHKPVSPARARMFADAAVKRHGERRRAAPAARGRPGAPRRRRLAIGACTALAAMLIAGALSLRHRLHRPAATVVPVPAAAAVAVAAGG